MSTLSIRWGLSAAVVAAGLLATGCTSVRQEFRGRDAGQVWTVMQAVAQSPEYRDWHVMNNEVWVDPSEARLEIYRVVERSQHKPNFFQPRPSRREYRFQVTLEETDPPTARFVSRGFGVPMQASDEGRRYFREVRRLLQGPGWDFPEREPWFEPRQIHDTETYRVPDPDRAPPPPDDELEEP